MKVNLPRASKGANLGKPKTKAVSVNNEGRVFLDTIPVSMQELEQRLSQHRASTPDFPVVVSGDGGTQYQKVMDVLDLLGRLGITQIGLATKPPGGK
jgi:biopolymer transport protein ExbD